jgi:hypothetical protein
VGELEIGKLEMVNWKWEFVIGTGWDGMKMDQLAPSLLLPIFGRTWDWQFREKRGELVNTGMLCDWGVCIE